MGGRLLQRALTSCIRFSSSFPCRRAYHCQIVGFAYPDPLSTSARRVSGKIRATDAKEIAPIIRRIQKTHLQPSVSAMIPPRTGPKTGPDD